QYEGFIMSNQSAHYAGETADFKIIFPSATDAFFDKLYSIYPRSAYNSTLFQRSAIYGDYIINCPTYYMASAVSKQNLAAYKLVFDAGSQLHGATKPFLHSVNQSNNLTLARAMKDWYLSFAIHQNPNKQSWTSVKKPNWPAYNVQDYKVMDITYTTMGAKRDSWASTGCDFFKGQSSVVRN
ncbi:hypothetical protein LTR53_011947, partial [Teratosphaeriaceae sp. CCFEE 6253]